MISGFKLNDKSKGMDKNHAALILKELGRFYASSLLFLQKAKLEDYSLHNSYPCLREQYSIRRHAGGWDH